MSIAQIHIHKTDLKIARPRAMMAGCALVFSGIIITLMVQQFLAPDEGRGVLTRSRLWWEIVLNVQLLCVGMMWFYYAEKIEDAVGSKRRYLIFRATLSVITVSVPAVIGTAAALNNWFELKPDSGTLYVFVGSLIVYWAAGLFLHRQIVLGRVRNRIRLQVRVGFKFFIPLYLLMMVIVCDIALGGTNWAVMTPILLSFQAATPYFLKAFALRPGRMPGNSTA